MSADNQQERFLIQLDPSYVIGLIDGEGYFSISARLRKQKTWALHEVKFTFGVKLKEQDGIIILYSLKQFFNCGSIYFRKDIRPNYSNCYEYQVSSHRDVFGKIIPFFQEHLLKFPSKQIAFRQFAVIAQMVQAKEHLRIGGIERIKILAKTLH